MGSESSGDAVCLPDIHLCAAGAVVADAAVGVRIGGFPALDVGDAVDELEVPRALRVAVSRAVFGTGFVGGIAGFAAVGVHRHKVDRPVETAGELGDVDVKSEFLVEQVEHGVCILVIHEIDPGSDILLLRLRDEVQTQRAAGGGDAVGGSIVGTVDRALFRANFVAGADGGVPFVASIAVGVPIDGVQPAPVCVDSDLAVDGGAAAGARAGLPGQAGVHFSLLSADLLGLHCRKQRREEEESFVQLE